MDFKLYNSLTQLENWLFPAKCDSCNTTLNNNTINYCSDCIETLPYMPHSCLRCGQPFNGFDNYCGGCLASPPTFDHCFCPFLYEEPISTQIQNLKYYEHPKGASQIANLFIKELNSNNIELPEAILAVPMHARKLRRRGFNHSYELAKRIAKSLDIPLLDNCISKQRDTPRQTTQSLKQRKQNLRGSYALTKKCWQKHVAIIDDVVTTGSTAEEMSKILKKNGVDYIQVWGIARTK